MKECFKRTFSQCLTGSPLHSNLYVWSGCSTSQTVLTVLSSIKEHSYYLDNFAHFYGAIAALWRRRGLLVKRGLTANLTFYP